jgi:pimeloyl-ACP methyl ester carboxylesterase
LAQTGAELILRPSEFTAFGEDLAQLKGFVTAQAPRYGAIAVPTVIITGDLDEVVPPDIHAKALAAAVPGAELVVLPGVGHMVQFAAPDRVAGAIAGIEKRDAQNVGRARQAGR